MILGIRTRFAQGSCADAGDAGDSAGEADLHDLVLEKSAGAGFMARCTVRNGGLEADSEDAQMVCSCLCGRLWGSCSGAGLVNAAEDTGMVHSCLCGRMRNSGSGAGFVEDGDVTGLGVGEVGTDLEEEGESHRPNGCGVDVTAATVSFEP